jgi:predicted nucleotide-binding protein (sugar kinase/HSP70/actin superfamily)
MSRQKLSPPEAIEKISGTPGEESSAKPASTRATIALIGHPYLLYDEYINHRLIHRLEQAGNKVLTPEMVAAPELESAVNRLIGGAYWTYEEEVVGAGGHYLQNGADGVIGIMAFGCGPDSLMMDMVRRQSARLRTTPFMCLTLEEHTAEAGVVTRLEAFTDMIYRKKRKVTKVCV